MKKQKVVCIWGAQGTGKSLIASSLASKRSFKPYVILDPVRPRQRSFIPPDTHIILIAVEPKVLENFCKRHGLVPTQWIHA